MFSYLRQVDPLVFEEIILSALEDAGAVVLRNTRYSGDGGVDGRCWLPSHGMKLVAVQVKRYGAHVSVSHVEAFRETVVRARYAGGLFVHCGRTGELCYRRLSGTGVRLISGNLLHSLLCRRAGAEHLFTPA
jgi:restriction system protein